MNTYLLVHRHPENYTGNAETAAAWKGWFQQLGSNLVDPGNAVFESTTVGECRAVVPLGGYTLVSADSLEGAVALARSCPILQEGGGVEVGKLKPVPDRQHPARVF